MNCSQYQNMLDDYLDGALSTIQLDSLNGHLNNCEVCSSTFLQAKAVIQNLKNIPVPPAKNGFEQRMLKFLEKKQPKKYQQRNWFMAGFGSALAATLTLWLHFSPVSTFTQNIDEVSTINLTVKQSQKVDLVFNLTNDLADATLILDLPNKIEIVGYPGKRQLKWKTSFKKGANRLALPLFAAEKQNGILTASLIKKGKTKLFRIRLNSQLPASSMFILDETDNQT